MNLYEMEEYRPNEEEEYMNDNQLHYFRMRLLKWRQELTESSRAFIQSLQESDIRKPDPLDQSAASVGMVIDFQTKNHQNRLIEQIDYAMHRIEHGEYGYCEVTGEEIGVRRLLARPVATMCVEVQERFERFSKRTSGSIHV